MKTTIIEKLHHKKVRPTAMRMLVYEVLEKNRKAMNLNEIEKHFENVERSTIFRTLKTFEENHIIHGIDDGTGAIKYALCADDCFCQPSDLHVHFLCNRCGQTQCLKNIPLPYLVLPEGFSFESANFVIQGTCSNCK